MAGSKEDEVLAIAEAHRAAQARVGIAGAYLSIAEWGSVSPQNASGSGASWVSRSLRMIIALRRKSKRLAASYVRLTRALETGYTLGYPEFSDNPKTLTMGDLRKQFHDLLTEIATMDHAHTGSSDDDEKWFEGELHRAETDPHLRNDRITFADTAIDEQIQAWLDSAVHNDSAHVVTEPFDWPDDWTADEVNSAFEEVLKDEVLKANDDKVKKLLADDTATPTKTMNKILETSDNSANLGGGMVDRYGLDAGREVVGEVWRKDKRVKAYARIARPNACAFCSLMASRGFVYKSRFAAGDPDMNKYHNHCHCQVVVRYITVPTLPPYQAKWAADYALHIAPNYSYTPKEQSPTGKGINNALNAWRRLLNEQRRAEGTYVSKNR